MQFFSWKTDWDLYRRQTPKEKQRPYDDFVQWRGRDILLQGMMPIRLYAEDKWVKAGRPYYNIHPHLVHKFVKTDLSKIPAKLFRMPHGLNAVTINLARQHTEFTLTESEIAEDRLSTTPAGSFVHSILVQREGDSIIFVVDFENYNQNEQPVYTAFKMVLDEASMQDCYNSVISTKRRNESYRTIARNVIQLVVTIGFLSDNPTICEADVLANDRNKFNQGDDAQREVIVNRARRRGKFGFNVGTDLMFVGERPKGEKRNKAQMGRELEYAHIRGGHPHTVRYGEDKKLVKIMWYVPITVRDDLPFKVEES